MRCLIPLAGPYLKGDSTPCWRFGVSQSPAYPAQPTCQGAKFSVWLGASLGPTATYTSRGTPLQSLECCFAGPNPYATRRSDPSLTIVSRLGRFRARLRPPNTGRKSMREYFVRRARDAHLPQSSSLKRSYAGEDIGTAPATPSGLTQLLASLSRANRG